MSWNRIIGQERVLRLLRSTFEHDRLPHAFLFHGPPGTGKDAVAIELARTLNCLAGTWEACGACPSCRQMDTLQHPNLDLVFPLPPGKNEEKQHDPYEKLTEAVIREIRDEIAAKGKDPYHPIEIRRASVIKINSIRNIKRKAAMRVGQHQRHVVIICGAEKMKADAANSLLKTLEEPNAGQLIILTTPAPDALLPTIISRCQVVRFDPIPEPEIARALVERELCDEDTAGALARLAEGSFRKALEYTDPEVRSRRSLVVEFMRAVYAGNSTGIMKELDPIVSSRDRQEAIRFLQALEDWFHDVIAIREGREDRIRHFDNREAVTKFAQLFASIPCEDALQEIEKTIEYVTGNVHLTLALVNLAHKLHRRLQPPP
ncbi:MAG: AAA family ATPase [Chlorobi bacterium]|nr:AAA family ATPase [Chlorobiota bacterium]